MARPVSRFPFFAPAEVASEDSVEVTRVTELTAGTRVTVKIRSKDQIFEATATVLYSRPTMGMAVAFREVKPLFRSMLNDWLHQSLEEQNRKPSIDNFETE
jgi:positive regulator of sigma E activity